MWFTFPLGASSLGLGGRGEAAGGLLGLTGVPGKSQSRAFI